MENDLNPSKIFSSVEPNLSSANVETEQDYIMKGYMDAGKNSGLNVLDVNLRNIGIELKKKQAQDEKKQETIREAKRKKINELDEENKKIQDDINKFEKEKNEHQEDIKKNKSRIDELSKEKGINKESQIGFRIGIVIIALLTIYLFIFYSSASFSAFFEKIDATSDSTIQSAIFNPNAFGLAWSQSFSCLLFVVLIPSIFLGLGYVIHQINEKSSQEKGEFNYTFIKIGILYFVTLIFDGLLAYFISRNQFWLSVLQDPNSTLTLQDFTLHRAFTSAEFYIVICCGFVAYVIWGLVYMQIMKNHKSIKNPNQDEINRLKGEIESLEKDEIGSLKNKIADKDSAKKSNEKEKKELESYLESNSFSYNIEEIEKNMNKYFTGWDNFIAGLVGKNFSAEEASKKSDEGKKVLEKEVSLLNNDSQQE